MDSIRHLLATLLFCTGVYLAVDLFLTGFNLLILAASITCFVLAYHVKPQRQIDDDETGLLDLIEMVIEIPYRLIAGLLRWLTRLLRGDIDGVDP